MTDFVVIEVLNCLTDAVQDIPTDTLINIQKLVQREVARRQAISPSTKLNEWVQTNKCKWTTSTTVTDKTGYVTVTVVMPDNSELVAQSDYIPGTKLSTAKDVACSKILLMLGV